MSSAPFIEGKTHWLTLPAGDTSVLVDADVYYRTFCRAALLARRYIYIAGWQFDSGALLTRVREGELSPHPIEFLPFLEYLCERNPLLDIYIHAWDYSLVYALEREWLQKLTFEFQSHPRVHFEFAAHPQAGGCLHQKYVVIDDRIAFLGGLDICDARWDTRAHEKSDPCRVDVRGKPYKPFHDIQVGVRGPAVAALTTLFRQSWRRARGQEPAPWDVDVVPESATPASAASEPSTGAAHAGTPPAGPGIVAIEQDARAAASRDPFELALVSNGEGVPLRATRACLSRTDIIDTPPPGAFEIEALLQRAISAAERLIYIETQYFTSHAIADALCRRLSDDAKSRLAVVLVMPDGGDTPKENFVLGDRQRAIRRLVGQTAAAHGHEFRLLVSSEAHAAEGLPATFIHSKLTIVDDEILCIGSANLTNRSMRVDSELALTVATHLEPEPSAGLLRDDIRALRAGLLAEHAGYADSRPFAEIETLIGQIDAACLDPESKLWREDLPPPSADNPLLIALFDPSKPLDWTTLDQTLELTNDWAKP